MDPFTGVYDLLSACYMLEKTVLGLPVLAVLFTFVRLFLWALLTPVCGRQAGLVANVLAFCAAFLLLAGGRGAEAVGWAADLAGGLASGLGLPHMGSAIAELRWYLNQAVWQLQSVF